ncbi:prefoldin subunit alpha [Candidatus Pacearchaeota archaeon CG09_land_8_20_14_0_10_30_9]|nr:MAG: prefoldin subunit alpha [Candidatus Pacearchaeota archaeon CG1_02_30_18]PIN71621.1 MAG: prefoldin subunit alpha [Candidatus Pacearchaeota archaeon CG11_big_fil_rev_8_21_14_0_20_30_13]PIO01424.1 MAG: prefoldin subunit alpha [Candidatus Pacearchaeota archaeon CG09_land_8_20_14_0_10_30_9]PIZ81861.1 MAG: prefoldin subunit alpha [Candidatus Pacearchaeota archaeon CG_4_10_14_0_2_um_filter_30_11]PJA71592.1 MAG: prefoldin subunit alpha [Candidatus Pacearchaeota archaeon CG_4_9_14_3_um_filter_30
MDEEINQRFRIFEREIAQIQEQLQAIEQATLDLSQINFGLDEIPKNKDSEILAPIGRGIFVKAKIISDELTVDVGEGTFVKKTIPETKKIILEQIEKLNNMKNDLENELEKINQEITNIMQEVQKKEMKNCDHCSEEDCECEESCDENCQCEHEH